MLHDVEGPHNNLQMYKNNLVNYAADNNKFLE